MKKNKMECFVNAHCCFDCPNFMLQIVDDRYGFGIADDMGLIEIDCKDCFYNSYTCCDCLFQYTSYCSKGCD